MSRRSSLDRYLGGLLAVLLAAVMLLVPATAAQADATAPYTATIDGPATVTLGASTSFTVTVQAPTSSPTTPTTGVVLTATIPKGFPFNSVPTTGSSPVASSSVTTNADGTQTVQFTLKPLSEALSTFTFTVGQNANTTKYDGQQVTTTLGGVPDSTGASPSDSVVTEIDGTMAYAPSKNSEQVLGSDNRTVTYTFNMSHTAPASAQFTSYAQKFIDQLPAGAQVLSNSPGWVFTGTSASGITATLDLQREFGPAVSVLSPSGQDYWIEVYYPESSFPTGTRPPTNTVRCQVTDANGAVVDCTAPASIQAQPLRASSTTQIVLQKSTSGANDTYQAHDGNFTVPFTITASYVSASTTPLETMVITDDATAPGSAEFWKHADLKTVQVNANPTLVNAAVPYELSYTLSDGSTQTKSGFNTSTLEQFVFQTAGSVGYPTGFPVAATETVDVPVGLTVTGWKIVLSPGAGNPIPVNSQLSARENFVANYFADPDATPPSGVLTNTAVASGTQVGGTAVPQVTETSAMVIADTIPLATRVYPPVTLPAGGSATINASITNTSETRTIDGAWLRVVLPVGVEYNPSQPITRVANTVPGTDIPVPAVGDGVTVSTERVTDAQGSHQVVVFRFADSLPAMRPLASPSDRGVEFHGFEYAIPTTVLPQAYVAAQSNSPAGNVTTRSYASTEAHPGKAVTWYAPFIGNDTYDFDPARATLAVDQKNSTVTTAGGLLLGKLVNAQSGLWQVADTVASPGNARYQIYVANVLPNNFTAATLFDRLPATGDGRGSEFPVTMTGPVTGLPAGATVEYSKDATSATNGTWGSDPSGATAYRIQLGTIAPGASMTLEFPVAAPSGLDITQEATNTAVVSGRYAGADRSYTSNTVLLTPAATPGMSVVKLTNDQDVAAAPGPVIETGAPVTWTYTVTNTGNTPLRVDGLSDAWVDGAGATGTITVDVPAGTVLAPGASRDFTATGVAVAGQYSNTATATGTAVDSNGNPVNGTPLTASDQSWYTGGTAGLSITKLTNGTDVTAAPGPVLPVGSTVTWTYQVTNTGSLPLADVKVTDEDAAGAVVIDRTVAALAPGETVTLTATGTATAGGYHNTVTATTDNPLGGDPLTASDESWYSGAVASLEIKKLTNDTDVTAAPGPTVAVGSTVTWTYEVTNTGTLPLTAVQVTDKDAAGAVVINETIATLAAGQTVTLTATGRATVGGYHNTVTATAANPLGGDALTASDESWYTGATGPIVGPGPAPGTGPGNANTLPGTGGSVPIVLVAVALLGVAAGIALLVWRRRARN